MKTIFTFIFFICLKTFSQQPLFGSDVPVTINGYSLDAMEPHISPDGNAMFFNSLNDGSTTSLYYAAKVNDSTFNLVGLVPVVNQSVTPRLDAVPSLDTSNNFYWVSTRDYPANFDNLHRVRFLQSGYTNFGRVHGDIYIYSPGWIIMDAAVNYHGDKLLYCNAYFNSCLFNMPCKSAIGLAQKINDSTFNKTWNSTMLLSNINDTANYIVYAPCLSKDGLELYYTRAQKNIAQTEICVSVRSNTASAFSNPFVLEPMTAEIAEAPTITTDKSQMYYHKKDGTRFRLFLRKRTGTVELTEQNKDIEIKIYPNPNYGILHIRCRNPFTVILRNQLGVEILRTSSENINLTGFPESLYFITITSENKTLTRKIMLHK